MIEHYNIEQEIEQIRNDYTNGSSIIARNAIAILDKLSQSNDPKLIIDTAEKLKSAKPTIISLYNLMNYIIDKINSDKRGVPLIIYNVKEQIEEATNQCIDSSFKTLFSKINQANIITCSYSSSVLKLIEKAHNENIRINLYALHSCWQANNYHKFILDKTNQIGINCEYLRLDQIDDILNNLDFGLIGADIIFLSGAIVNGIPSFYMANKLANKVPLYAIGESFKLATHIKIEDGFDYIPQNLISQVIIDYVFSNYFKFKSD